MNTPGSERVRSRLLAFFFAAAFLLLLGRAAYFAGPGRSRALRRGREIACIEGVIPAPRGTLSDAAGQPLAWSERRIELVATTYSELTEAERDELFRLFPKAPRQAPCIVAELHDSTLLPHLKTLLRPGSGLRMVTRTFRHKVITEPISSRIGSCRADDAGILVGVDGLEREYDEILRGEAGRYEVMVDRYRNWIPRSWKLLREPRPGQPVRIPETMQELSAEKGGEK